jgi:hypothetical protein
VSDRRRTKCTRLKFVNNAYFYRFQPALTLSTELWLDVCRSRLHWDKSTESFKWPLNDAENEAFNWLHDLPFVLCVDERMEPVDVGILTLLEFVSRINEQLAARVANSMQLGTGGFEIDKVK